MLGAAEQREKVGVDPFRHIAALWSGGFESGGGGGVGAMGGAG